MDLWIRSQDKKKFEKVENVEISPSGLGVFVNDTLYGIYKTEERALEVLDEIYSKLDTGFSFTGSFTQMDICIKGKMLAMMIQRYEMPEE